jgi:hypothetical protein
MVNTQINQAIELLTAAGLINITKPSKLAKGTLMFSAPGLKGIKFALYANGYYRKYISVRGYYDGVATTCYQLNRQTREKAFWGGYTTTGRILIPGQYVLMAQRIIAIYNKNLAKNKPTF